MKRLLLCSILFLCLAGEVLPQTPAFDSSSFIKEAEVSYKADFVLNTSGEIWEKILDNAYLAGRLWKVYGFWPRYEVKKKGDGIHVVDPSGLEGDVVQTTAGAGRRVFFGAGRINHWAIPIDATGSALFIFQHRSDGGRVRGSVEIYIAGDRDFTNFLLKVGAFVMRYFIDDRFKNNLRDMQKMLSDIEKQPDNIRGKLKEEDLREFNRVFQPLLPST